jgi:ABC-type uncharacterized transport system fused permease/ATPase subunit
LHSSGRNETIQALMFGGNVRDGRIESSRVLHVYLAVVDRASELADTLLGFVKVRRRFIESIDAVDWIDVSFAQSQWLRALLTVSASFNKSFSKGQPKTSSSASDDEDTVIQLRDMSVQLDDKGIREKAHLEFSKAVRWLRLSC